MYDLIFNFEDVMPIAKKKGLIRGRWTKQYATNRVGKKTYVNVPEEDFNNLLSSIELAFDKMAFTVSLEQYGEGFPSDVMKKLMSGANPIKTLREWRGFTQKELAKHIDSKPAYVSQLETGNRDGSISIMASIAEALEVSLDDLVSY